MAVIVADLYTLNCKSPAHLTRNDIHVDFSLRTDIEQEVNGLYTFDRAPKLDVTRVKAIMDKAKAKYFSLLGSATNV